MRSLHGLRMKNLLEVDNRMAMDVASYDSLVKSYCVVGGMPLER